MASRMSCAPIPEEPTFAVPRGPTFSRSAGALAACYPISTIASPAARAASAAGNVLSNTACNLRLVTLPQVIHSNCGGVPWRLNQFDEVTILADDHDASLLRGLEYLDVGRVPQTKFAQRLRLDAMLR